jgi:hypothetical protein
MAAMTCATTRARALRRAGAAASALLLASLGCASTQVDVSSQYQGYLPRPTRILIFPFATSPEDVQLDWSPTAVGAWKLQGISASAERQKVGQAVAEALAKKLVTKVQALGLPAEFATGPVPAPSGSTLAISGQFLAIDEGNRAERVVIGLGAGRSDVRTAVQVAELFPEGRRLVESFEVDAKSGRKPGAAETMGVGAAAGHLAVSAAVTAAGTVASEAFGDDVEADAERTAAKIATVLQSFFMRQGWIPPQ